MARRWQQWRGGREADSCRRRHRSRGFCRDPVDQRQLQIGCQFHLSVQAEPNSTASDLIKVNGTATAMRGSSNTWRVGVLIGYSRISFDRKNRNSSARAMTITSANRRQPGGDVGPATDGCLSLAQARHPSSVAFAGLSANSMCVLRQQHGSGLWRAGYHLGQEPVHLEPFAAPAYVRQSSEVFNARSGLAA